MTSLEYYIESIEQFISMLTDDIESGEGTIVTQTKLAVYREVLEHLEEIEQEPSNNSIKTELKDDMISRQAVCKIIDDIRDCISVEGYWALLERLKKLPPVNPQPSGDLISRQSAIFLASDLKQDLPDDEHLTDMVMAHNEGVSEYQTQLSLLPSVKPQYTEDEIQKMQDLEQAEIQKAYEIGKGERQIGHCKDCKFFEYDSVAKVDGIPLIVAHEICSRWGDGCKTKEDGYCFMFEPQERSDEE